MHPKTSIPGHRTVFDEPILLGDLSANVTYESLTSVTTLPTAPAVELQIAKARANELHLRAPDRAWCAAVRHSPMRPNTRAYTLDLHHWTSSNG